MVGYHGVMVLTTMMAKKIERAIKESKFLISRDPLSLVP
jgi:hypothetical protein